MVSIITASSLFIISPNSIKILKSPTSPTLSLQFNSRKRGFVSLNIIPAKYTSFLGFSRLTKGRKRSFCWFCKNWEEEESDLALEAEILEFMKNSENPKTFPMKKQLIDAGRMDLVEGILSKGGWLAYGWDSDENAGPVVVEDDVFRVSDSVVLKECDNCSLNGCPDDDNGILQQGIDDSEDYSFAGNGSHFASSSGRSVEVADESGASGIEGILSGLEKQRNMTFGLGLRDKGNNAHIGGTDGGNDRTDGGNGRPDDVLKDTDSIVGTHLARSSRAISCVPNNCRSHDSEGMVSQSRSFSYVNGVQNSFDPEMWRTWSLKRAGVRDTDFEVTALRIQSAAAEIDSSKDDILEISGSYGEPLDRRKELDSSCKEINSTEIRTRLKHLESELSSALHELRSQTDEVVSPKGPQSSEDLQKLSDAWEFQENEIMHAGDKLRSTRARLAVLEGKMALAIIDAQKIVDEKQKKIDDAHRALHLLRTACIVWPNSASEVLLAGSFDGWATQKKMEKSSVGIFSLSLKLYPGKYEIKFIVDGIWRIDPLRPIVNNGGYENNLLIIT
ncbi:AMP-activated protein kinase, glycogen-binding domain [Dillenia turbinata]|uniref:AMP-activated protein kinase, glycogen-binding domain n=1 Tax=Dillenia turbinata TaxID=194707 RepID=A0AAN8Z0P8_9MAGN